MTDSPFIVIFDFSTWRAKEGQEKRAALAGRPWISLRKEWRLVAFEDLLRQAADLLVAELEEELLLRLRLGFDELLGHVEVVVEAHARAGRDDTAHDHVLLQTPQAVHLAADRRLGEHTGGLLEARGGDEAVRRERRLGDAQEQRPADGGGAAGDDDALVLLLELPAVHLLVDQELGVADLLDLHRTHHLAHDHLDVLVVDGHALRAVDLLDLVGQVALQLLLAQHLQDVVGIHGSVDQGIAGARFSLADASTMIVCDRPVALSVSSRAFSPSTMSWNSTLPPISERMAEVKGSQVTSSVPGWSSSPSCARSCEP